MKVVPMIQHMSKEDRLREIALTLGANLHRLRLERNLSLNEVAEMTGLNYHTVRRIELGEVKSFPKNPTLVTLAKLYKVEVTDLFDAANAPAPKPVVALPPSDVVPKEWYDRAIKEIANLEDKVKELEAEIKKKP